MKKFLSTILILATAQTLAANVKSVKSSVKNVTVFIQSAQVFRNATVSLNPGITDLVFTGISPLINPSSLQAGSKSSVLVLDVKHNIKYPEPPKPSEGKLPKEIQNEIKSIEDSITELGFLREEMKDIKIEMKDSGKANYNDKTGLLQWNTTVGTKEYKTLSFSYAVTFNKDMPLNLY